jgi:hypothetical protein
MKQLFISSERKYNKAGAYRIVYEWEDVISKELNIEVVNSIHPFFVMIDNLLTKIDINFCGLLRYRKIIHFQMLASDKSNSYNSSAVIPWIIDFYLPKESFKNFFKATKRNKIVFISSKEVFDLLKLEELFDDKKYIHLPLSLPNKYKIDANDTVYEKKYDCVLVGRQDRLLEDFVKKYAVNHPKFTYVYSVKKNNYKKVVKHNSYVYYSNKGVIISSDINNENYVNIIRSCRVGLWSTRGLEDSNANGYNQVTPRFFELLSAGCHIICRYPKNSDTDFFLINQFCENIETYESFKNKMDYALSHSVDIKNYSLYLNEHYTLTRVSQLKRYLINLFDRKNVS